MMGNIRSAGNEQIDTLTRALADLRTKIVGHLDGYAKHDVEASQIALVRFAIMYIEKLEDLLEEYPVSVEGLSKEK